MRIIILTQYFLPEMGAPQNRLFELVKGFQEKGCEVEVISAMPNYPTGKIFQSHKRKFSQLDRIDGVTVKRYWIYASNSARSFPRIISMLSFTFTSLFSIFFIRRKKTDFIFVESPPLTLAFSAWLLSIFSGSKMIMNVSDLWPLSAKELGAISKGSLYRLIERFESFLYNRAALCTGQSEEIVDYIKSRSSSPVYLFRNGVDTTRFNTVEEKKISQNSQTKIVYAGLLGIAQGIFELCQSIDFASLGAEFHIYGAGAEAKLIEKHAEKSPDSGIVYKGVMSRNQMPEILLQYDATIVALVRNIYGAVPSKIYEAMAAGLPIFFSGEGEGAKIVLENHIGWINNARDWIVLSDNLRAFIKLKDNEKLNIKLHCRSIAKSKFDRRRQISELYQYIDPK